MPSPHIPALVGARPCVSVIQVNVSYAFLIWRVSAHAISTFSNAVADTEACLEGRWDTSVDTACDGLGGREEKGKEGEEGGRERGLDGGMMEAQRDLGDTHVQCVVKSL